MGAIRPFRKKNFSAHLENQWCVYGCCNPQKLFVYDGIIKLYKHWAVHSVFEVIVASVGAHVRAMVLGT